MTTYEACPECYWTAPSHETGCPNWPDEPVKVTLPRSLVEHIGWLVEINHGAWSDRYKALAPYLLNPKPDPSTPIALEISPNQKLAYDENGR